MSHSLKKAAIEHATSAQTSRHFGYDQSDGSSSETAISDDRPLRLGVLRDRERCLELQIIGKQERRFTAFDQKIIAMYARGTTERAIQGYLAAMYGAEVSTAYIGKLTDEVMTAVVARQSRPLEPMYPVVFFDILRVTIRDDAVVRHKWVCLALGILADGTRDVLGIWIAQTEGTSFWLRVFNELRSRGVGDILIAVIDSLDGVLEAIGTAFPSTAVQTYIMHLIRDSLDYTNCRDRKTVAEALRSIYTATTATAAHEALQEFASVWGTKYTPIVQTWQQAWEHIIPFVALPLEVRRVIYATTVIESLHIQLRRIVKTRGHFPSEDAVSKLLWLALRNSTTHKVRSTRDWKTTMQQFAVLYGDRCINPKR